MPQNKRISKYEIGLNQDENGNHLSNITIYTKGADNKEEYEANLNEMAIENIQKDIVLKKHEKIIGFQLGARNGLFRTLSFRVHQDA